MKPGEKFILRPVRLFWVVLIPAKVLQYRLSAFLSKIQYAQFSIIHSAFDKICRKSVRFS